MDRIEEVKKILDLLLMTQRATKNVVDTSSFARQICQLFEPKPLPDFVGDTVAITQSEEGRLLTDEEIKQRIDEYWDLYWELWNSDVINESDYESGWDYWTLELQDIKTASIKDAECDELKRQLKLADGNYLKLKNEFDARIEALIIEIFAKLCNPKEDEVQTFAWALSQEALEWLYKMQSNAECARIVSSLLKAKYTSKGEEG